MIRGPVWEKVRQERKEALDQQASFISPQSLVGNLQTTKVTARTGDAVSSRIRMSLLPMVFIGNTLTRVRRGPEGETDCPQSEIFSGSSLTSEYVRFKGLKGSSESA